MNWRDHIVHWTQLPEDTSTGGNATEWNFYRRRDALIGLDVALECRLHIDGPGRQFTLDY